jgi:protein arginine kinase activator
MYCQLCKEKAATVKISHVINEKKIELGLCNDCAEKKGVDNDLNALPHVFGNLIMQLLGHDAKVETESKSELCCSGCGLSWDGFHKTGLLGCEVCYQSFAKSLNLILRRIHGSTQHIGDRPHSMRSVVDASELQRVKIELDAAIANEDFELAAKLRDLVHDAERSTAQAPNDGILR